MSSVNQKSTRRVLVSSALVALGAIVIAVGWLIPSRFKSIPRMVLREAGVRSSSILDLASEALAEREFGVAASYINAAKGVGLEEAAVLEEKLEAEGRANPLLQRWGGWDPFLDAALGGLALEAYSPESGMLGLALSTPCRDSLRALLEGSRDPMVRDLLETGTYTTYKRLFPIQSVSGRPLEATLLSLALLAQGDRLTPALNRTLRNRVGEARASGDVASLEDFYLDVLSLARGLDWGRFKALFEKIQNFDTASRMRYLFHRSPDTKDLLYSVALIVEDPEKLTDYLGLFGDDGVEDLKVATRFGVDAIRMLVRERLPLEEDRGRVETSAFKSFLVDYSLKNPSASLAIKYLLYFAGAFLLFWGLSGFNRFYRERNPPLLVGVQRMFISLASVIVLVILSEPYLASGEIKGYSFKIVMPVLAQVDGETIIVETEPSTSMEPATLLSISFFFLLQILVFMICLLKVRQIDQQKIDSLVKLKLMENEENLFDAGLYVGIAGTCISLVMQVLDLIQANLLAAYSSNLFGILGVAIVKIRLVRPYKNKLILASQDSFAALSPKANPVDPGKEDE